MEAADKTYNPKYIEKKWRIYWEQNPINTDKDRPKFYCLDMFPYPSGSGLHVGHWRGYVLSDVLSRYKLLNGNYIVHPMGWDSFGLPAENFAIKNNIHPSEAIKNAKEIFKRQLIDISAVYNWEHELDTTDPKFYKWTQWIFIQMFKNGLAYEKEMPLNWCPNCKVVLANEEATAGMCERCKGPSTKRNLRQWMLKITKYAERLLVDLDKLNWPQKVKRMQKEWIGKSYGAKIDFEVKEINQKITVFSTRPDTLFGATFIVLAPEHELVLMLTTKEHSESVASYIKNTATLSTVDRLAAKEKSGVFTGSYAVNPISGEKMQIWIGDYVLADYGTGAIMSVPGHDARDFEFAKRFGLPILQVISKDGKSSELTEVYVEDGILLNSGNFSGLTTSEAKEAIANYLAKKGIGEKTTNYRLRDWVFSRQRYWGEPIPLVHCEGCGVVPVPDNELPVKLPHVKSYHPTDTGESPLALISEWVNVPCPACSKPAKRETNTMPQWAGSSWYFLRYIDVANDSDLAAKELIKKYLPVDYYVGGVEHAVLHLLYARFYTKFLNDIGIIDFDEPFTQLFNQGMVTRNGSKMDKSRGNGVSPDEILKSYGSDALRMYILFIGPPELDADWNDNGIEGVYRFLAKLWRLFIDNIGSFVPTTNNHERMRNKMIYDITIRIDNLTLNTAISGFMEYTNKLTELSRKNGMDKETAEALLILLAPFAPHISEELWQLCGYTSSIFKQKWPSYDKAKMVDDNIIIVVQINGKVRENVEVHADASKDEIISAAKNAAKERLNGFDIVKEVYVPNKLVNFVVKQS